MTPLTLQTVRGGAGQAVVPAGYTGRVLVAQGAGLAGGGRTAVDAVGQGRAGHTSIASQVVA